MLTLLSAPETLANPSKAKRFIVEIASTETVLDSQGNLVPNQIKKIDMCVTSADSIAALLQAAGYLESYRIVNSYIPEDCDCF